MPNVGAICGEKTDHTLQKGMKTKPRHTSLYKLVTVDKGYPDARNSQTGLADRIQ
jgi:hypothetical protein